MTELRCIHRHTIKEHPSCFAKGLVRVEETTVEEIIEPSYKQWYKGGDLRIGYLDIESDGLQADFATMLSWCVKEKGGDTKCDVVNRDELFAGVTDKRIVASLCKELRSYDIIVTYYGTGFDVPFVRTKALRYGIYFPTYSELYHYDLYYTVRNRLCLSRNSLANACDYLGIVGKTPLDKEIWRTGKYGDPKSLALILEHNVGDVEILEKLHDKVEPFQKWTKKSI